MHRVARRSIDHHAALMSLVAIVFLLTLLSRPALGDDKSDQPKSQTDNPSAHSTKHDDRLKLTAQQQRTLDHTVDKALDFLALNQKPDGSFPTHPGAEPAITSLCVMAFLSRGHVPGKPPYGRCIERGVTYVLQVQDGASGAIIPPGTGQARRGNYNHAISALMLCDLYLKLRGTSQNLDPNADLRDSIKKAIEKALVYARKDQLRSLHQRGARGGWRYLRELAPNDSDLSATAWMVMFFGSARKAGFTLPKRSMESALTFVRRTFDEKQGGFRYALAGDERYCSRATVGAGIICLYLGNDAANPMIKDAADWITRNPFEPYNGFRHPEDRYHYSAFYCSQAMSLVGKYYFADFYPRLLAVLSENQHEDGSWDPEATGGDAIYGNVYTTALAVLALSPPYQKLDTYRR
jgi:hypothetical protein